MFIRAGIPYKVVGGVRFYERKEIRDIVAYLRVLDNPGTRSACDGSSTPARGIGDRAEACVAVYAENTGCTFADALTAAAEGRVPMLNTRSEKAIAAFVELLDGLRGHLADELGDLVEAVLDRTGYRRELESSSDPQDLARPRQSQRIGQRRTRVQHRPRQRRRTARRRRYGARRDVPETGVLAEFLERVSLVADSDDIPRTMRGGDPDDAAHRQGAGVPGGVRHRLGGRHVPRTCGRSAIRLNSARERRLAYVGITGRVIGCMSAGPKVRSSWGQPMLNPVAFPAEIPEDLIDWRRTDTTSSATSLRRPWWPAGSPPRPARCWRDGPAPAQQADRPGTR